MEKKGENLIKFSLGPNDRQVIFGVIIVSCILLVFHCTLSLHWPVVDRADDGVDGRVDLAHPGGQCTLAQVRGVQGVAKENPGKLHI